MTDIFRYINLRFETQHLFPTELTANPDATEALAFLQSVGFDLESRG